MPHGSQDPLLSSLAGDRRYPVFFPSVSSVKTNMRPVDYVRLLKTLRHPRFLVSAYDLAIASSEDRPEILRLLFEARGGGGCVLLDSGNYESFWKADSNWTQDRYHQELRIGAWDVAFSFDKQGALEDVECAAEGVAERFSADADAAPTELVPIVHGAQESLPAICRSVIEALDAKALAIPERELGFGIVQRFKTLQSVRRALDPLGNIRVHLLGTGNPHSMLLYALAGADSFDGLEWCQTVVDHDSGLLHHFAHYPIFQHQTPFGGADGVPAVARALAHNLVFFSRWELELKVARETGSLRKMAEIHLPRAMELVDDG